MFLFSLFSFIKLADKDADDLEESLSEMLPDSFLNLLTPGLQDGEQVTCTKCNNRFKEQKYLNRHLKECGLEFPCEECNKSYKSSRSLRSHVKSKHSK